MDCEIATNAGSSPECLQVPISFGSHRLGEGGPGIPRPSLTDAWRRNWNNARPYLDAADVILLVLDLDGRVVLINRKGLELMGWTESELVGRGWIESCLPPRVRHALRAKFDSLIAGDLSVVENPILTRDGRERIIEWHNTVLNDEVGNVVGTFSSGMDITEHKRTGADLAALRAEAELQRRRVFEATMRTVHDIVNNFLNALQGLHHQAADRVPPEFAERVAALVHDTAEQLRSLGNLETIVEKDIGIGRGIDYAGNRVGASPPEVPGKQEPLRLANPSCPQCRTNHRVTPTLHTSHAIYFLCGACYRSWSLPTPGTIGAET